MTSNTTTSNNINVSSQDEQNTCMVMHNGAWIPLIITPEWNTLHPYEQRMEKCGEYTFVYKTLTGIPAKGNSSCGVEFCEHENCIKERKRAFMNRHSYVLKDPSVQITKIGTTDLTTIEGIDTAFKDLNEFHAIMKRLNRPYRLLIGKDYFWAIYWLDGTCNNRKRRRILFNHMATDYTDLSIITDRQVRNALKVDHVNEKRTRYHGLVPKEMKTQTIKTIKINNKEYATLKKANYMRADKCKNMEYIQHTDIEEAIYITLTGEELTFHKLFDRREEFEQEIKLYFGNKFDK